jgi:hypothetical protein
MELLRIFPKYSILQIFRKIFFLGDILQLHYSSATKTLALQIVVLKLQQTRTEITLQNKQNKNPLTNLIYWRAAFVWQLGLK